MADLLKQSITEVYKTTLGSDEVIIGDEAKTAELVPKICFTKWNKEESLSIQYEGLTPVASAMVGKELAMDSASEGFYFNPYSEDTFKFGLVLYEIPKKEPILIDEVEYYQWSFKLTGWENFDFFYQPPLTNKVSIGERKGINIKSVSETQALDDFGNVVMERPEDCIGSYAVYHKNKKDYIIGQINYGCGKFGHIYRPKFIDALGKTQWAILNIENGQYSILVDKKWLDSSVYPIKANDTFGKTDIGASSDYVTIWSIAMAKSFTIPSTNGSLTSVSVYGSYRTQVGTFCPALYSESGGHPATRLAYITLSGGGSGTFASSASWVTSSLSYSSITTGVQYWFGLRNKAGAAQGGINFRYDSGTTVSDYITSTTDYPATWSWQNDFTDEIISIYATYTPNISIGKTIRLT